jgi:hypothetical protein
LVAQRCVKVNTVPKVLRSPDNNPFQPGFGAVPDVWAGRATILHLQRQERRTRKLGRYTRGAVFIGPSGIGKSVLVNKFAQESMSAGDLVIDAIRVAKRSDPLAHLAGAISAARQHVAADTLADVIERTLRRVSLISVKGVQLAARQDGISNPHVEVRDSIIALAEVLARENAARPPGRERVMLLRIDELQNADESQRSAILAALGDVLEHQVMIDVRDGSGAEAMRYLPVLVYLTGLPELLNRRSGVDTFRRRFHTTPLGMLTDDEVLDALNTPLPGGVRVSPQAARRICNLVAGDPYVFQLVGHAAWNASSNATIEISDVEVGDQQTYGERLRLVESALSDVSDGEMGVLRAVYDLANHGLETRGALVAQHLGKSPAQIATFAGRLEQLAAIRRDHGVWRIENRLLHRYLTTGDIAHD